MNVSLNWLKERLDLGSRSLDEVCDLLTFAGIEVEGLKTVGVQSDQIVVAEIKEAVTRAAQRGRNGKVLLVAEDH